MRTVNDGGTDADAAPPSHKRMRPVLIFVACVGMLAVFAVPVVLVLRQTELPARRARSFTAP